MSSTGSVEVTSSNQIIIDGLWSDTLDILSPLSPHHRFVHERFAHRPALRGNTQLYFNDITLADESVLRATRIVGKQVAIFNVMIFPADAIQVPIFASEIVVFGNQVRAAVIDLQPANPDLREQLESNPQFLHLQNAGDALPHGGTLPDWCADYFTQHAIWCRDLPVEEIEKLHVVYIQFLQVWMDIHGMSPRCSVPTDQEHIRTYKDHHISNSPGVPFLSSAFGTEWTHDFLRQGMYA